MSVQFKPDFISLENNITDVMKEEQIKLGYAEETIRLYYPVKSLNNLLGADFAINELPNILNKFCFYVKERLGQVEYSLSDERICIVIPQRGVAYVHEEIEERYFLKEFIGIISKPSCSIQDILLVFHHYSDKVKCEKVTNGEFDYLIYFEDEIPDPYRYCIKFEDCHIVYHRFTKSDYLNFGF